MVARNNQSHEYPDDIFDNTRMTFGEHIEELRKYLIRALAGLMVCLVIGFILDGVGQAVENKNIGVGKPMLAVITEPVESQVRDFYNRRNEKIRMDKLAQMATAPPEEIEAIRNKLADNNFNLTALSEEERRKLLGAPEEMPVVVPVEAFAAVFGPPKEGAPKEISFPIKVYPGHL